MNDLDDAIARHPANTRHPAGSRRRLTDQLWARIDGNPTLQHATYALLGGFVLAGASVESALALCIRTIDDEKEFE